MYVLVSDVITSKRLPVPLPDPLIISHCAGYALVSPQARIKLICSCVRVHCVCVSTPKRKAECVSNKYLRASTIGMIHHKNEKCSMCEACVIAYLWSNVNTEDCWRGTHVCACVLLFVSTQIDAQTIATVVAQVLFTACLIMGQQTGAINCISSLMNSFQRRREMIVPLITASARMHLKSAA